MMTRTKEAMAYCETIPGSSCVFVRAVGIDVIAGRDLLVLPIWTTPSGVARRAPAVGERCDTYRDGGGTLYLMGPRV